MFEEIARIVEVKFATDYTATPVRFRNVPFKQPPAGEWIAPSVIPGDGVQASLGDSKLERQLGVLMVQVFTPKNSGDRRAKALADLVAALFRYKTIADSGVNVIFRAPAVGDVGERIDSYQVNVNVPFQAEKIFSS